MELTRQEKEFLINELYMLSDDFVMQALDNSHKEGTDNQELYNRAMDFRDGIINKLK